MAVRAEATATVTLSAAPTEGPTTVPTEAAAEAPATKRPSNTPRTVPTRVARATPAVVLGSGNVVSESRILIDFSRVSLIGIANVFITQGEEQSLVVEAEDNLMQYIRTEVKDGTLLLGFTDEGEEKDLRPTEAITFNLSVKQVPDLDLSGVGDIHAPILDADSLEIALHGVGDIHIGALTAQEVVVHLHGAGDVHVGTLTVDEVVVYLDGAGDVSSASLTAEESLVYLDGAGDVELAGQVVEQSLFLDGTGSYLAADLESQIATIDISGNGYVIIWVSDILDVRITGPSTVEYYGDPQVSQDVSRLGRLVHLGGK